MSKVVHTLDGNDERLRLPSSFLDILAHHRLPLRDTSLRFVWLRSDKGLFVKKRTSLGIKVRRGT